MYCHWVRAESFAKFGVFQKFQMPISISLFSMEALSSDASLVFALWASWLWVVNSKSGKSTANTALGLLHGCPQPLPAMPAPPAMPAAAAAVAGHASAAKGVGEGSSVGVPADSISTSSVLD